MAIGILEERFLTLAQAPGPGNLVILFGSATGRDGIGGASVLASATFTDDETSKRPSVQVGDPFAEKLLIEASLELIERGLVEGLQDLGAGGITCATSETADRAGTGMLVDLDAVPRREPGHGAVRGPHLGEPGADARDRPARPRGAASARSASAGGSRARRSGGSPPTVTSRSREGGREIVRIPARALTSDAIVHDRLATAPARRRPAPAPGRPGAGDPAERLPERGMDPGAVLMALLGSPNLASRRPVREQYDSTVQVNTVGGAGHGAAVLRVKGTTKALVASTDGNATVGGLDPWLGAAMSVAEATRNVSITGARPLGVTNCLNYGDPTRPEAFWQLSEAVRGLGDACRALGLPVTGGNVSLYNESPGGAILPTPEIGVVGLLEDVADLVGPAFVGGRARDRPRRRGDPGAGRQRVRPARRGRGGGRTTPARSRAGAPSPGVRPRGRRPGARRIDAGRLGRRPRRRPRRVRDVGPSRGRRPPAGLALPGRRPLRREPESGRRRARVRDTRRRSSCSPVSTGCPWSGSARPAAAVSSVELAGAGATGAAEARGSRVADPIDIAVADLAHTWEHGLARALDWEAPAAAPEGR